MNALTLSSLLGDLDLVDLIDLDVQGAEAEVLEAAADDLAAKVKRVHIGTHGIDNEERCRALFTRLGWSCLNDYPSQSEAETPYGTTASQDGVQTWINPKRS